MSQVLKVKKKIKKLSDKEKVNTIFQWASKEFEKAEELFTKRKYEIILETAKKLEDLGIEKTKISTEISHNLARFVDAGYVRRVLQEHPEYKDKAQKERGAGKDKDKGKSGVHKPAQEEPKLPVVENETGDDNAPTGYYEMPVEDFRIKDIQLYDRDYLLQIVTFLFEQLPQEVQKKYK